MRYVFCFMGLCLSVNFAFAQPVFDRESESVQIEREVVAYEAGSKKENFLTRMWNRITGKKKSASRQEILDENLEGDQLNRKLETQRTQEPVSVLPITTKLLPLGLPVKKFEDEVVASAQAKKNRNANTDTDGDTFLDVVDLCPQTPGDANGCPDFSEYRTTSGQKNITLRRLNQVQYDYEEFDQIRIGDTFQLQVIDPLTANVIMTSDPYIVEK